MTIKMGQIFDTPNSALKAKIFQHIIFSKQAKQNFRIIHEHLLN